MLVFGGKDYYVVSLLSGMGLCEQIHDHKPTRYFLVDVHRWHNKHILSETQTDTIKGADKTLRFDVQDIAKEWRVVDMMCECIDLIKELEEMKHHGTISRASVA